MNTCKAQSHYEKDRQILVQHRFQDLKLIFQNQFEYIYRGFHLNECGGQIIKSEKYVNVVHTQLLSQAEKKETLQELQYLKQVKHQNLAQLLQIIQNPGESIMCVFPYNISIFLSWGKLHRAYFSQIDPFERIRILGSILNGLKEIHQRGKPFKYLNPQNILVNEDNYSLISYRIGNKLNLSLQRYIAPQVRYDFSEPTFKADVWSLGLILLEMLSGLSYRIIMMIFGQKYLHDIAQLANITTQERKEFFLKRVDMLQQSERMKKVVINFLMRMFDEHRLNIWWLVYRMLLRKVEDRPCLEEVKTIIDQITSLMPKNPDYKFKKRVIQEKQLGIMVLVKQERQVIEIERQGIQQQVQVEQFDYIKKDVIYALNDMVNQIHESFKELTQSVEKEPKAQVDSRQLQPNNEDKTTEESKNEEVSNQQGNFLSESSKQNNVQEDLKQSNNIYKDRVNQIKIEAGSSQTINKEPSLEKNKVDQQTLLSSDNKAMKEYEKAVENIDSLRDTAHDISESNEKTYYENSEILIKPRNQNKYLRYSQFLQINQSFYGKALEYLQQFDHKYIQMIDLKLHSKFLLKIESYYKPYLAYSKLANIQRIELLNIGVRMILQREEKVQENESHYFITIAIAMIQILSCQTIILKFVKTGLFRCQYTTIQQQFVSHFSKLKNLTIFNLFIRHNLTRHTFFSNLVATLNSLPNIKKVNIYIDDRMIWHEKYNWTKQFKPKIFKGSIYVPVYGKGRRCDWKSK